MPRLLQVVHEISSRYVTSAAHQIGDAATGTLLTGSSNAYSYDASWGAIDQYLCVTPYSNHETLMYKRTNDTFNLITFSSGINLSITRKSCSFTSDGKYLAIGLNSSPFISLYRRDGDTFTKLSNPSSLPTAEVNMCRFSNDGNYLIVSYRAYPSIIIYRRDGDTFTALSTPTVNSSTTQSACAAWSIDDAYLAVSFTSSINPRIMLYSHSGDNFTVLPAPVQGTSTQPMTISFSPDSTLLFTDERTYDFNNGTCTTSSRIYTSFTSMTRSAFSPDNNYLALTCSGSYASMTYLKKDVDNIYKAIAVASKLTPIMTSYPGAIAYSKNGTYFAVVGSGEIYVYK